MKRYGCHIPFYENEAQYINSALTGNDAAYEEDEINFADIKFLLWHHYQQSAYVQEAVPFLFGTLEVAAKVVYDILDKEYETAPENERMREFLCEYDATMEKDMIEVSRRDVLAWFHYGCYFNLGNQKRLQFTLQQMANSPQGLNEQMAYAVQMDMTITLRNNLLSLTSYEWLQKICENQPSHAYWEDEDFNTVKTVVGVGLSFLPGGSLLTNLMDHMNRQTAGFSVLADLRVIQASTGTVIWTDRVEKRAGKSETNFLVGRSGSTDLSETDYVHALKNAAQALVDDLVKAVDDKTLVLD